MKQPLPENKGAQMSGSSDLKEITSRLVRTVFEWKASQWYPLSLFSLKGKAAAAFYREELNLTEDVSGIYFLRANDLKLFNEVTGVAISKNLFYIGRSGGICKRLNRHLKVVKHDSASLAYMMTALGLDRRSFTRNENMNNPGFIKKFLEIQSYLREQCKMAYHSCDNDAEQALLEIMFSIRFKTQFNEWKTH